MAIVLWHSYGVIFVDYQEKGKIIKGEYYAELLQGLDQVVNNKRLQLKKKKVLSHQDNAPAHRSAVAMAKLHETFVSDSGLISTVNYYFSISDNSILCCKDAMQVIPAWMWGQHKAQEQMMPRRQIADVESTSMRIRAEDESSDPETRHR